MHTQTLLDCEGYFLFPFLFVFVYFFCEIRSVVLMEASKVGVHSPICPLIQISQTGIKGLQEYTELYSITHFIQCFIKDNKIISVSLLDGFIF